MNLKGACVLRFRFWISQMHFAQNKRSKPVTSIACEFAGRDVSCPVVDMFVWCAHGRQPGALLAKLWTSSCETSRQPNIVPVGTMLLAKIMYKSTTFMFTLPCWERIQFDLTSIITSILFNWVVQPMGYGVATWRFGQAAKQLHW